MNVHISGNQKTRIKQALKKRGPVTIRLSFEDLQGEDILAFTLTQLTKLATAFREENGVTIRLSKTQVEHKMQIEDAFIFPLLSAIASAALPTVSD
jgi:2,4-dienoyl-CoA reductase-like NADH-dependent reductase (Old Yellow Enzyme family)